MGCQVEPVLFTNSGKKSGKHKDPERHIRLTVTDNVGDSLLFDRDSVEIAAQTDDEIHILNDLDPGDTAEISFRIVFQANQTGYYLRYGRGCVSDIPYDDERAFITRVDEDSWSLESIGGRSARVCTGSYDDLIPT